MEQTEKTKRPHSRLLWLVLAAVLVFAATAAMAYQSAQNYTGAGNNISEHVMAKTESKEATYWEEGNLVYWQCSNEACKDKYYKDENGDGQYENKAATVIPKLKYFETGTVKVTPTNEANRATENKNECRMK